jgi:hypothetical protein
LIHTVFSSNQKAAHDVGNKQDAPPFDGAHLIRAQNICKNHLAALGLDITGDTKPVGPRPDLLAMSSFSVGVRRVQRRSKLRPPQRQQAAAVHGKAHGTLEPPPG